MNVERYEPLLRFGCAVPVIAGAALWLSGCTAAPPPATILVTPQVYAPAPDWPRFRPDRRPWPQDDAPYAAPAPRPVPRPPQPPPEPVYQSETPSALPRYQPSPPAVVRVPEPEAPAPIAPYRAAEPAPVTQYRAAEPVRMPEAPADEIPIDPSCGWHRLCHLWSGS
jgi:hypothetical protein